MSGGSDEFPCLRERFGTERVDLLPTGRGRGVPTWELPELLTPEPSTTDRWERSRTEGSDVCRRIHVLPSSLGSGVSPDHSGPSFETCRGGNLWDPLSGTTLTRHTTNSRETRFTIITSILIGVKRLRVRVPNGVTLLF